MKKQNNLDLYIKNVFYAYKLKFYSHLERMGNTPDLF